MINEVAWAGTLASPQDEWIELFNTGLLVIDLNGWFLTDGGDINISLRGKVPSRGYFLLERTDDTTVSDIRADQIYTGALRNSGEILRLKDPSGVIVDSANQDGGSWPAGDVASHASMERIGRTDTTGGWRTYTGYGGVGHDAGGYPIAGTPRHPNSGFGPTPTSATFTPTPAPTRVHGKVRINEVLIRPHYDWEGDGKVGTGDEFIELYNTGESDITLGGWMLDDILDGGSRPYSLPGVTLAPGDHIAFFRSRTRISLNDRGDSVHLIAPNGQIIDQIRYLRVRAYNLSYGRLPDGSDKLTYGLWPTPGGPNVLFVEPLMNPIERPREITFPFLCPNGGRPFPRFPRVTRHPSVLSWLFEMRLLVCR
jgi:hypothetical protein